MTPDNLIGNRIIRLFERITEEFGGLDQGKLFIQLETGNRYPELKTKENVEVWKKTNYHS